MRRLVLLGSLALLAAALVRRLRRRTSGGPLAPTRPVAELPAAPRFLSAPWTLAERPANGPQLVVRCTHAADTALDRVDVRETPTQVFVTALVRGRTDGGERPEAACETDAVVALSGPLEDRELVHAPVDVDAAPARRPVYP